MQLAYPLDMILAAGLGAAVGGAFRRLFRSRQPARPVAPALERALRSLPANHLLLAASEPATASDALDQLEQLVGEAGDEVLWLVVRLDLADVAPGRLVGVLAERLLSTLAPEGGPRVAAAARAAGGAAELARGLRRATAERSRLEGRPVRVLLLLDHATVIESWPARAAQQLRGLLSHPAAERLTCAAASSGLLRRWNEPSSPWFNVFEEIELTPREPGARRALRS